MALVSTPNQTDAHNELAGHPDPVRYDVAAGLARHRELVATGAALPDWAKERGGLAHATLRGVVLTGLAGLMLGVGFLVFPRPDAASGKRAPSAAHQAEAPRPISVTPVPLPQSPTEAPTQALKLPPLHVSRVASPRHDATPPARPKTAVAKAVSPSAAAPKEAASAAAPKVAPSATAPKVAPAVPTIAASDEPAHELPTGAAPIEPSSSESHAAKAPTSRPQIDAERPEVLTEMEQLKLAERLLAREPKRTLSIVRAGLEQFRPGYFTQERRYIEVMALLALGSTDEARMRGRVFLRDYPEGPYRRKVERALSEAAPGGALNP